MSLRTAGGRQPYAWRWPIAWWTCESGRVMAARTRRLAHRFGGIGQSAQRRSLMAGDPRWRSIDTVLERHRDRPARARSAPPSPPPGSRPEPAGARRQSAARREAAQQDACDAAERHGPPAAQARARRSRARRRPQVHGRRSQPKQGVVPADSALVISPGTASTSRPSSSAKSAVISAPLRSRASTTTVARQRPAMILLRAGNRHGAGSTPGSYSETTRPVAQIRLASSECAAG